MEQNNNSTPQTSDHILTKLEIKLELSKVAIMSGTPLEKVATFYRWVIGDEKGEKSLSEIPVGAIIPYLDKVGVSFSNRCRECDIKTIQDLVNIGSGGFREIRNIGPTTQKMVADALEKYFGVTNW